MSSFVFLERDLVIPLRTQSSCSANKDAGSRLGELTGRHALPAIVPEHFAVFHDKGHLPQRPEIR